jgi:hypothetical protein
MIPAFISLTKCYSPLASSRPCHRLNTAQVVPQHHVRAEHTGKFVLNFLRPRPGMARATFQIPRYGIKTIGIAEVGVNHYGRWDICRGMVEAIAKRGGTYACRGRKTGRRQSACANARCRVRIRFQERSSVEPEYFFTLHKASSPGVAAISGQARRRDS